jgi:hypothetical protein
MSDVDIARGIGHPMTNGVTPCALGFGHKGQHRSAASVAQRRAYWNRYNHTVPGILRNVRMDAKRRGSR